MTAMSFSIATTVPLITDPSCTLPWSNDSSSIEAKSSCDGAAAVTAMNSPVAARRRVDDEKAFRTDGVGGPADLRQLPNASTDAMAGRRLGPAIGTMFDI